MSFKLTDFITVSDTGNVGIGTTDVKSTVATGTALQINDGGFFWNYGDDSVKSNYVTQNMYYDGVSWKRSISGFGSLVRFNGTNGSTLFYQTISGSAGSAINDWINTLSLTVDGNVGIGTLSPTNLSSQTSLTIQGASVSRLDLLGASGAGGGVVFGTATAFTVQGNYGVPLVLDAGTTADMNFNIGGSTKLTISSGGNATFSGNVGIGIAPSANSLHIYKSDPILLIQSSNTSGDAELQFFPRDGSNVAHLQSIKGEGSSLVFSTGGNSGNSYVPTPRLTISSGGNADFSEYVRVKGDTAAFTTGVGVEMSYNSTNNRGQIGVYDRGNSAYKQVYFYGSDYVFDVGGTPKLTISSAGLTQINSTSTTALELITNQSASSLRLKNTGSIVADWIMQSGGITAGDLAFYNLDTSAYRLTISSGGNVGIGTSTIESYWSGYTALKVGYNNSIFGNTADSVGSAFFISQNLYNDGGNYRYVGSGSDEGGLIDLRGGAFVFSNAPLGTAGNIASIVPRLTISSGGGVIISGADNTAASLQLTNTASSSTWMINTMYDSGDLRFLNGSVDAMRITSGGNVGIGTTTLDANANLTVFGNYRTDFIRDYYGGNRAYILRFGANTASSGHVIGSQIVASLASDDVNGSLEFYTKNAGNLENQLTITSGGNVGIAKSPSTYRLDLETTSGGNGLKITRGTAAFQVFQAANGASYVGTGNADTLHLITDGSSKMSITSGGVVNINTTGSGTNKLQVGGGMTVWYDSNFVRSASVIYDGLYINGHNGYLWQGTAHDWVIGTNGTERMRVTSGGTVQVYGTASANALSIDHSSSNDVLISIPFQSVNQDFIIRNSSAGVNLDYAATSWVSASDENIKENITSLDNVLDKIKNIRCVNYNLKDEEIYKKRLGFIAQDFQENFEEVTSINNDDVLGLRYTETIPILMKAIQEQQTQIEELKSEIQLLKNN